MGRWAQAQRRGGGLPVVPIVRAPSGTDLSFDAVGSDPPDFLRFDFVQNVPEGMNWYFYEVAAANNHAAILTDGDDNFLNFPRTLAFDIYPGGTYDMHIAWGRNGVMLSGWSDWVNLDF